MSFCTILFSWATIFSYLSYCRVYVEKLQERCKHRRYEIDSKHSIDNRRWSATRYTTKQNNRTRRCIRKVENRQISNTEVRGMLLLWGSTKSRLLLRHEVTLNFLWCSTSVLGVSRSFRGCKKSTFHTIAPKWRPCARVSRQGGCENTK